MTKSKERIKRAIKRETRRAMTPAQGAVAVAEVSKELNPDPEERPVITAAMSGRQPGTIIGDTKVVYTYQDLEGMFSIVSFTPEETMPLTYQGVRVQALAGVEFAVPKCFKDIYDKTRRPKTQMKKELADMGIKIDEGAGALL